MTITSLAYHASSTSTLQYSLRERFNPLPLVLKFAAILQTHIAIR